MVNTEFVPLEGEEEGEGSFLGSICCQHSLGNLDPSNRTTKESRVKTKNLCLQEPNMMMSTTTVTTQEVYRALIWLKKEQL